MVTRNSRAGGAVYGARMSIPVTLETLAATIDTYGPAAFFLTAGAADPRPHVSHAAVRWEAGELCVGVGRSGARNLAAVPAAVLLWPPVEEGGYSLIVDVQGRVDGDVARLVPERAVLHRPAPTEAPADAPADGSCGQDCRPV